MLDIKSYRNLQDTSYLTSCTTFAPNSQILRKSLM